jgi:ribonucleotide reductase alpha subunit
VEGEDRNEAWWETVRRGVEGSFNVQKEHCAKLRLPWKNAKAQRSAQIMYDKIFNFKFLPPGRGLWMMGTEFIETRGGASLNNCAFCSTDDIDIKGSFPFCFTMDALMLGVGVGFDTKGAGKITIKQPKNGEGSLDYTVPDSREGWVEGLELVLDAFFYGRKMPKFDFSLVRPYGSPIKGFGGTASGPGPLREMYINITELLYDRIGEELTSTDIVDIFNMIGVCVVAGNVRRSAEIAIGEHDDKAFVTMKDYKKHPKEMKTHRWASNNSVFAEVGQTDYSKFSENKH